MYSPESKQNAQSGIDLMIYKQLCSCQSYSFLKNHLRVYHWHHIFPRLNRSDEIYSGGSFPWPEILPVANPYLDPSKVNKSPSLSNNGQPAHGYTKNWKQTGKSELDFCLQRSCNRSRSLDTLHCSG